MANLIVVSEPRDWPIDVPGVRVVSAREYLTDARWAKEAGLRVFNLGRSYRYQRNGYYVSLLATARGHKVMPSIGTIQDLKSQTIIRVASDELEEQIQKSLAPIQSKEFVLSVYFGRNVARRHESLAAELFKHFQAPLLRAFFAVNERTGRWYLANINPIAASDVADEHWDFLVKVANEYFSTRQRPTRRRSVARYDLAILHEPEEAEPPSDERAMRRFVKAAEATGFAPELITKDDYGRIAEFDALLIRETTSVNHRTFRFARRAHAEGLVVIDDPDSILKCTNKVFLAELLASHKIPAPKTVVVHRGNVERIEAELGFPCVLKQPDSSFSQGVAKVETREELAHEVAQLLERSDLIVAQEFRPTEFDWRIGVIDRQPLYACRYHMARQHWQIIKRDGAGRKQEGRCDTMPVELAPTAIVKTALKAANLIGDGLYGVDLKQDERGVCVIEVNDNPSIDSGVEDAVLKEELYLRIMRVFLNRIEQRKRGWAYT
jgi:glutathione synthase/RimK-type ligase-like ATP-grasp enzyme